MQCDFYISADGARDLTRFLRLFFDSFPGFLAVYQRVINGFPEPWRPIKLFSQDQPIPHRLQTLANLSI
jgi:hypothetical protein